MPNTLALRFAIRRRGIMPHPSRRPAWSCTACMLVALLGGLGAHAQSQPRALRLLQRASLPKTSSVATDIRWASAVSVYVSWYRDGVAEVGLDGARRRLLVPDLKAFGRFPQYSHLTVSPRSLAIAAQGHALAWRSLKATPGGEILFQRQEIAITEDLDLSGDRILLLGLAKLERGAKTLAPTQQLHGSAPSLPGWRTSSRSSATSGSPGLPITSTAGPTRSAPSVSSPTVRSSSLPVSRTESTSTMPAGSGSAPGRTNRPASTPTLTAPRSSMNRRSSSVTRAGRSFSTAIMSSTTSCLHPRDRASWFG